MVALLFPEYQLPRLCWLGPPQMRVEFVPCLWERFVHLLLDQLERKLGLGKRIGIECLIEEVDG